MIGAASPEVSHVYAQKIMNELNSDAGLIDPDKRWSMNVVPVDQVQGLSTLQTE
jgi:hypothetical protein